MRDRLYRKGLVLGVIVGLVFIGFLQNISGKYLERKQIDVESIDINHGDNEKEYWGVCVVAFDGPYDDAIEPFIYDSLLEAENWDKSHIKLLFRENATRAAIIDALDWLIENVDENDVVLFSDHSHGTFRRADKKYGIVPIDSEISGIITVDELDEKFDAIKAEELCLIFDCCLAGS